VEGLVCSTGRCDIHATIFGFDSSIFCRWRQCFYLSGEGILALRRRLQGTVVSPFRFFELGR
jgi:hypothetical protein